MGHAHEVSDRVTIPNVIAANVVAGSDVTTVAVAVQSSLQYHRC